MNPNTLQNQLINFSFGSLLISLITYWFHIAFINLNYLKKIGKTGVTVSNICIVIILTYRWILNGYFPLSNLYESLLFLTWGFTFTQILLERQIENKLVGAINVPIALFTIAFASFSLPTEMQQAAPLVPALRSNWLMMHVTIMMLSYSSLIIGSLLSILFLIISHGQEIKLKGSAADRLFFNSNIKFQTNKISHKSSILNNQLNFLESIDNLSYRIIGLGFPMLTVGIIAGAVWANEAWGSYWSWDPKETWALITWLTFASYLHSRFTRSWTGKKPAILASIGFFIIWICYLGVNFLGKGLHTYGWLS